MNAYRSVRSAVGSFAIRGASRWLDAFAFLAAFGVRAAAPIANAAIPVSAAAVTAFLRMVLPSSFDDRDRSICGHIRSGAEFGSVGGGSSHFANRSQDGAYACVVARTRTVLVVDDERTIADVVARYLERDGYRALVAHDGEQAVEMAERERPDLVVLDVMLPHLDGLQVMAMLRRRRPTPVILLTARGDEQERVSGLRLGADDYVVKPFSPAELVARGGAVLRRLPGAGGDGAARELLEFGDVAIDEAARACTVRGRPAELTAKEFELLLHLARNQGRAFSRDDLMDAVWRYPYYSNTATVTVHVRRVRHKIEEDPLHPRHLVTVWGVGYKLVP